MHIIAIMGSPKGRGAGHNIVRMVEETMTEMGEVRFEYLFLKETDLRPCTGCYVCMAQGEDRCPLKDDRADIERRLLAADGVILSTPVCVANVSALMKTFLDRFAYTNHRPRFHRQKVMSIVNMAGGGGKETLAALRFAMGGRRIVEELAIETPPWLQSERSVARKERAIRDAARRFYRACEDPSLPEPTFNDYLNFSLMQKLSLACREALPADHEFYRDKVYYFPTNRPITASAARVTAWMMMKVWARNRGPGDIRWPLAKARPSQK